MKYFIGVVLVLLAVFAYFFNTSPSFRHVYHLITDSDIYNDPPLVYKDITVAKDVEGEYRFSCKYPELYAVGIGIRIGEYDENYPQTPDRNWIEDSPITLKIEVISEKGDILLDKVVNTFIGGGLTKDKISTYTAARMEISDCKNLTLRIKHINGDFGKYEGKKNILYLFFRVSGYI